MLPKPTSGFIQERPGVSNSVSIDCRAAFKTSALLGCLEQHAGCRDLTDPYVIPLCSSKALKNRIPEFDRIHAPVLESRASIWLPGQVKTQRGVHITFHFFKGRADQKAKRTSKPCIRPLATHQGFPPSYTPIYYQ